MCPRAPSASQSLRSSSCSHLYLQRPDGLWPIASPRSGHTQPVDNRSSRIGPLVTLDLCVAVTLATHLDESHCKQIPTVANGNRVASRVAALSHGMVLRRRFAKRSRTSVRWWRAPKILDLDQGAGCFSVRRLPLVTITSRRGASGRRQEINYCQPAPRRQPHRKGRKGVSQAWVVASPQSGERTRTRAFGSSGTSSYYGPAIAR